MESDDIVDGPIEAIVDSIEQIDFVVLEIAACGVAAQVRHLNHGSKLTTELKGHSTSSGRRAPPGNVQCPRVHPRTISRWLLAKNSAVQYQVGRRPLHFCQASLLSMQGVQG